MISRIKNYCMNTIEFKENKFEILKSKYLDFFEFKY